MSQCNEYNNGCKLQQFQKNNYYFGKLMSVAGFDIEQKYMEGKRHLLNRLISGPGITCGFDIAGISLDENNGIVEITFATGGAAIDRCGREIVVPDGSKAFVYTVEEDGQGNNVPLTKNNITTYPNLYLRYKTTLVEPVQAIVNASHCEEKTVCRHDRIVETFEVIASNLSPANGTAECPPSSLDFDTEEYKKEIKDFANGALSKNCEGPGDEDPMVFLIKVIMDNNADIITIDQAETFEHRTLVYNNKLIRQLLLCHLSDFDNPHKDPEKAFYQMHENMFLENNGIITIPYNFGGRFPVVDVYKKITCDPCDEEHAGDSDSYWRKIIDCNPSPEIEVRIYDDKVEIHHKGEICDYELLIILRA